MQQVQWHCKHFSELNNAELYDNLQLRSQVFVVEQQCIFLDIDGKDKYAHHLLGYINNQLVASSRLMPPNSAYTQMSIGRVVSDIQFRRLGIGMQLMENSIENCFALFGKGEIKIGAQLYLKKFYESVGFTQTSEVYLEDGIDHIEMIRY